MEVEAWPDKGGGGVRQPRGVGVRPGPRGRGVAPEGVERRLDSKAPLSAAPLRRGLLSGGEGEGADRDEGWLGLLVD